MNLSLSKDELIAYTSTQLNNFFPDKKIVRLSEYSNTIDFTLDRVDYCFSRFLFPRYFNDGNSIFNHLYSDQYLIFLYMLANSIWKNTGNDLVATKLYYLNKSLHAFDCMYDTDLPNIFFISHGIGTMLGKAKYSDYFVAMQGCSVGAHNGNYPQIGKGVSLTSHSSIIGNCKIGEEVSISSNTSIFEIDIPDRTVAYKDYATGALKLKAAKNPFFKKIFKTDLFISTDS